MNDSKRYDGDYGPMETLFPDVSRETLELLKNYISLVWHWNLRTNLTGAKSPHDYCLHHVLDCYQFKRKIFPQNFWVDVGSGNGLPGIVWAILSPEESFLLIDSSEKKAGFLHRAVSGLALGNCQVENSRIENLSENVIEKFSSENPCIVSRGTAPPTHLFQWATQKKINWKYWYVFSSERTHQEFLTLGKNSAMKIRSTFYEKIPGDSRSKGIITRMEVK